MNDNGKHGYKIGDVVNDGSFVGEVKAILPDGKLAVRFHTGIRYLAGDEINGAGFLVNADVMAVKPISGIVDRLHRGKVAGIKGDVVTVKFDNIADPMDVNPNDLKPIIVEPQIVKKVTPKVEHEFATVVGIDDEKLASFTNDGWTVEYYQFVNDGKQLAVVLKRMKQREQSTYKQLATYKTAPALQRHPQIDHDLLHLSNAEIVGATRDWNPTARAQLLTRRALLLGAAKMGAN